MRSYRGTAGVCVGLFLIAVAAWAENPPGAPDDHFQCYKAKTPPGAFGVAPIAGVTMVDSYETGSFDIQKAFHICSPADKNGEGVIDATTHLEAFKIKTVTGAPKHVKKLNQKVVNQFGQLYLDTIKADLLLVPAAVDPNSPPAPLGANNVDYYKCYKVRPSKGKPRFVKRTESVDDGFSPAARDVDVKTPKHLCLPASVGGSGIKTGTGHLLCYKDKPSVGQPRHTPIVGLNVRSGYGPELLDTKKESEFCVPSILNPVCGDGAKNQPSEQCDGADDAACPGDCTPLCACPSTFPFDIDSANSQVRVRGASGYDLEQGFFGLSGSLLVSIGGQYSPGVYEVFLPTAALAPVDVLGLATACVFLTEDPSRPGSGISGSGVMSCFGTLPPQSQFPSSPDLRVHLDHCTNGTACDSYPQAASCTSPLGSGGAKLHVPTGVCVPEAPEDLACTATDALTGTTATPEASPHGGVCNSPLIGGFGTTPWRPGDALVFVNVAVDIRGPGNSCSGPPASSPLTVPLTTGTAVSTIMDAFPSSKPPGTVQALSISGTPFACPDALSGTFTGAALVSTFGVLDQSPLSSLADINAGIQFTAQ